MGSAGGAVTAIDVVDSRSDGLTVDVTCSAADAAHSEEMVEALRTVPGVKVRKVSDRTFLLHLGGKIEVTSRVPLKTRDDLSMAYTPGVARVCLALADHPEDVRRLTIKGNTVAVVTDGSAVLGLGNIGPGAALPVMEGKAALFKRFGDIDAWPICLDTQDVDEIVRAVELIAPGFGGINLEDIAAPRCFEIEARLREKLDIPVFHDDQHGTAIVALAALRNALRVVDKRLEDVKVVVAGGGAAGTAIVNLLLKAGAGHVLVWDREGILSPDDERLTGAKLELAQRTNPAGVRGELPDALVGADVFIGVSAGNILAVEDLARMAPRAVIFPMANPTPEVDPVRARAVRRRRRVRPLGHAEPDQQRARVPRRLPGTAGRAGHRDHRRHAARRGRGAGRRRQGRPAQRQLHHPQRVRPRGDARGGRGGRRPGPARARRDRPRARRGRPHRLSPSDFLYRRSLSVPRRRW